MFRPRTMDFYLFSACHRNFSSTDTIGMGSIQPPKEGVQEIKLEVAIPSHTFLCTIHETSDLLTMYLGGHTTYCVQLQAYKQGSVYETIGIDILTAKMPELFYNELCSLTGAFRRKLDTERIFTLSISILKSICPWITTIQLIDTSHRSCGAGSIELPMMNYILYGKTWYERMYGAYLRPEDAARRDARYTAFSEMKKTISWETMAHIMQIHYETECINKTSYDAAASWQEFFEPIYRCLGKDAFCEFALPFLNILQTDVLRYNFLDPYCINIKTFPHIQIHAKTFQQGGNKGTRKRRHYLRRHILADMQKVDE